MSLLDLFRGKARDRPDPPNIPIDITDSGDELYYEDIVSGIKEELEKRRSDRAQYELQWTLNANFLAGHQMCDIDTYSRKIRDIPSPVKGNRDWRVYNRIAPLMETRAANLGSVSYDMVVNPRSPEPGDWEKALISTKLLEYSQSETDFKTKEKKLIGWAELCGTAFTISWWDSQLGEKIAKVVHQDENGISEKELHSGDIAFGLVTCYEVFPQSLTIEEISDQHDIIIERVLDAGEIFDLYGRLFDGEEIESYVLTPINGVSGHGVSNSVFGVSKETRSNCERVIMYIENPSRKYPEGRLITIVKDEIVYYGSLPGGINPLVAVKSKSVAGQFFGKSVIQDLIPLQRAYNECQNKVQDFIDTVANNPWLVPAGSLDLDSVEETGIESGSIIEYNPRNGKPEIVDYPEPPTVLLSRINELANNMEYAAGVSQLMVVGAAPSGVTSGTAIDNLRQIDSTRMSLTADSIRNSVKAMAVIWLKLNKAFSSGYRVIMIAGNDEKGGVYTWCADDINSFDVDYAAENELRNSKEQQRNDFVTAYNMGLLIGDDGKIEPQYIARGRELFDLNPSGGTYTETELQIKNAQRESAYLSSGRLPERFKYDDDEIHLEEHIKFALSAEYRILSKRAPEYIKKFDEHIDMHKAAIAQKQAEAQAQAQAMMAMNQGNVR